MRNSVLTISRVALKALVSYSVKFKLVEYCLDAISELVPYCKLTPCWVPDYSKVEGNKVVDELARLGSAR